MQTVELLMRDLKPNLASGLDGENILRAELEKCRETSVKDEINGG